MKRARGGRRHVLQLDDNKESYLAKYGYSRAEEEDSRDGMDEGNEDEIDQSTQSTPEHLPESTNGLFQDQNPPDIDNKVADFLAEIDALHEDDEEEDARPSFKTEVEIPPPTFQLNPNQQLSKPEEEWERLERVKEVKPASKSGSGKSAYGSMFVKGGSEFVREQTEPSPVKQNTPEVEWPEEPTTVWQQTLDDNTGCNYYWNTVTNEVTWEIPPDFTSYLLKYRDYEETVARLTKEGKVKPAPKQSAEKPKTQPQSVEPMESSSSITPQQAEISVSSSTEDKSSKMAKSDKSSKSKSEETVLPDSSNSKGKAPKLVAYFGGSSDESASDSSEDSESSDEEDSKKKEKKKKTKVVEDDESLDIDDIDKALDVALEKKTTEKEKGSRYAKGSKDKKSDREPKSKSLVDALKETIQKKQEVEARRKAAIEEMMARELERRVGPPKRRPTPEEPSLHSNWDSKKVLDYQHGRKRKRSDEYEHSLSRSSREKESRHKHEDRKKHKKDDKDRDRRKEKDDGKKKEKDDHSKKKDKHEEKKRDEKKKHKDKDREERKKDKKKDKERESVEKTDGIEEGKGHSPKKETQEEVKVETESESLKEAAKEEVEEGEVKEEKKPDVDHLKGEDDQVDEETVSQRKAEEKQKAIQLANLKLEASELAELALSKLEFLEVTKKGLSKLQILLIELETRQQDWQAGGLSTEYFLVKLEEANRQLQLYERNAAPPGWSCHWDRAYRRYFYMNKRSGKTQWDYPDDEEEEEEMEGDGKESYPDMEDRNRENSSSVSPPKFNEVDTSISEAKTSCMPSRSTMEELHPTVSSQAVTTHPEPTLSRSKLLHSEHRHKESTYSTDANLVSSSDYGAIMPSDPGPADTTASVVKQTRSEPDELVESSEMHSTASEAEPVSQSTYDYSVATASVLQGQPPPPGTDLELLLKAPPPPPPPDDKEQKGTESITDGKRYTESPYTMYGAPSHNGAQPGYGTTGLPTVHRTQDGSYYGSEPVEEPCTSSSTYEALDNPVDTQDQPMEEDAAVIARPPQVIAREPMVFSEPMPSHSNEGVMPSSEQFEYQGEETYAKASGDANSSSYSEKKKKKKDKSMSSSNLTLKKKHVSSLVQKWQKVKKEVEIEERNREEREMAIRQKLEEWKQQDY